VNWDTQNWSRGYLKKRHFSPTAASAATVAKCATANDGDPDDGDRNNVVIPHNTVKLNDMMEDLQSDIEKQLKYWGKKEGEGNAVLDKYAFYALNIMFNPITSETQFLGMVSLYPLSIVIYFCWVVIYGYDRIFYFGCKLLVYHF
jgi:hypothetical protein